MRTAGIGETVLLSGVVQDLQECFPLAKITFFTGLSNGEMAEMIPGIKVVRLPVTKPFKALRLVRRESFDLWIDCEPWPRISALWTFFARAGYTLGFKTKKQHRHYLYDQVVEHKKELHNLENCRNLLKSLSIRAHHQPSIPFRRGKRDKTVVLHLCPGGSQASLKMWPREKWTELTQFFLEKGYDVYFTGTKKDREKIPKIDDKRVKNVAGGLSLRETATLLVSAQCVISVDTGIMHLAAALGCPVIALHGPTTPFQCGGIGPGVVSVEPDGLPCRPCLYLGFEKGCGENRCMQRISVQQVKNVFETMEKDENSDFGRGERDKAVAALS